MTHPSIINLQPASDLTVFTSLFGHRPRFALGEDAGTEDEVIEAVEYLLSLGTDVDAIDNHGETAMHGAAYKNLPAGVELLPAKGADISAWNKPNEFGWTSLTIARGYRFGNFKPSAVTVEVLERVMLAAGGPIPLDVGNKTKEIY